MMIKCNNNKVAEQLAADNGLSYGSSIFPPRSVWYVGSDRDLKEIGVLDPRKPLPTAQSK